MSLTTTEKAFETAIEDHLLANGYAKGDLEAFDRARYRRRHVPRFRQGHSAEGIAWPGT